MDVDVFVDMNDVGQTVVVVEVNQPQFADLHETALVAVHFPNSQEFLKFERPLQFLLTPPPPKKKLAAMATGTRKEIRKFQK